MANCCIRRRFRSSPTAGPRRHRADRHKSGDARGVSRARLGRHAEMLSGSDWLGDPLYHPSIGLFARCHSGSHSSHALWYRGGAERRVCAGTVISGLAPRRACLGAALSHQPFDNRHICHTAAGRPCGRPGREKRGATCSGRGNCLLGLAGPVVSVRGGMDARPCRHLSVRRYLRCYRARLETRPPPGYP